MQVGNTKTATGAVQPATPTFAFKKADTELQVVWGEVFAPGFPDSQGDFMTADEIRQMMFRFMKADRLKKIDVRHSCAESGAHVVECFQAREGDPRLHPRQLGSGRLVPERYLGRGEEGRAERLLPRRHRHPGRQHDRDRHARRAGRRDRGIANDHFHSFVVKYDADGTYLGGVTGPAPDGHFHKIIKGAATEMTEGHNHRFSFVEGVLNAHAELMGRMQIEATELKGTDVSFVSLVKHGANRIPFRIVKEDQEAMLDLGKIGRQMFRKADAKPGHRRRDG